MKRILITLLLAATPFALAAQEALFAAVERLQKEYPQGTMWGMEVQPAATGASHITAVNFTCRNTALLSRPAIDSIVAAFERELPRATESIRYANKAKSDTVSFILNYGERSIDNDSTTTFLGNFILGNPNNRAVALLQRGKQTVWVAVKSTVQMTDTTHQGIDYAPIDKLIATEMVAKGATCRPAIYQCAGYHATSSYLHCHSQAHMNGQYPTTGLFYLLPPAPGNWALLEKFRQTVKAAFAQSRNHFYNYTEERGHLDACDEWKRAIVVHMQPDGSLAVLKAEDPSGQIYIPYYKHKLYPTFRNGQFGD